MMDKETVKRINMDLKPCPFCGSEAKIYAYPGNGVCVMCTECHIQTLPMSDYCIGDWKKPYYTDAVSQAIEAWNRRAE